LDEWRLVDAELTPAQSSKPWSDAEVAVVELVGDTDLGRRRGRQMEYGRDGRHVRTQG
jgi:hypothetical protein